MVMRFPAKKNAGCPKAPHDFPPRKDGILYPRRVDLALPSPSQNLADGRTDGRSRDYYVTTKISRLDRLPNFLSDGAPLSCFARRLRQEENTFYPNTLTTYWRRLSSPSRRQNPAVPTCLQRLPPKIKLHGNHLNELADQYFIMVQFITLYKMVLTFALVNENQNVTIEMKATDQELGVGA